MVNLSRDKGWEVGVTNAAHTFSQIIRGDNYEENVKNSDLSQYLTEHWIEELRV